MTEQEYNAAEGVRRSDLWKMEDSPEKFRYFLDHPAEQTPAMAFGSACHKVILEPETFTNEYAVAPAGIDRRTKAGKEAWESFMAYAAGKTIVSAEDMAVMMEMKEQLEKCPLARELLFGQTGQNEVALFWKDPETGEKCKVKIDRLIRTGDETIVIDYKTAQAADTARFNNEVWRLGYYFQAGMYTEGLKHLWTGNRARFIFVVQEKKAPYAVNVVEVSEDVMKAGVAKFHELLQKYHDCKEADIWPGYVDGDLPNETTLPGWFSLDGEDE